MNIEILKTKLIKTLMILFLLTVPILAEYFITSPRFNYIIIIKEFPLISIILLALGVINFYSSKIKYNYAIYILLIFLPIILFDIVIFLKILLDTSDFKHINGYRLQFISIFVFILSLVYYFFIEIFIEFKAIDLNKFKEKKIKKTIGVSDLLNLVFKDRLLFIKTLIYVIMRIIIYVVLASLITIFLKWIYKYESNLPNNFTIFSTILTVIIFACELFINKIKSVNNRK